MNQLSELQYHLVLRSLFREVINVNQTIMGPKVFLLFWNLKFNK